MLITKGFIQCVFAVGVIVYLFQELFFLFLKSVTLRLVEKMLHKTSRNMNRFDRKCYLVNEELFKSMLKVSVRFQQYFRAWRNRDRNTDQNSLILMIRINQQIEILHKKHLQFLRRHRKVQENMQLFQLSENTNLEVLTRFARKTEEADNFYELIFTAWAHVLELVYFGEPDVQDLQQEWNRLNLLPKLTKCMIAVGPYLLPRVAP